MIQWSNVSLFGILLNFVVVLALNLNYCMNNCTMCIYLMKTLFTILVKSKQTKTHFQFYLFCPTCFIFGLWAVGVSPVVSHTKLWACCPEPTRWCRAVYIAPVVCSLFPCLFLFFFLFLPVFLLSNHWLVGATRTFSSSLCHQIEGFTSSSVRVCT